MTLKEMLEAQARAFEAFKAYQARVSADGYEITAEDQQEVTRMETELLQLDKDIASATETQRQAVLSAERLQKLTESRANVGARALERGDLEMAKKINIRATKEYSEGFISALRGVPDHLLANRATLQADSDIGGGIFTASQTFIDKLIMALDADVVIQKATTVFQAAYNEDLGAPSLDGDISDFTFGGELTDSTEDTGIAFGARHLKVNKFNRKTVKISKQLLQSPRMDVEGIVVGRVNTALARTCERHYMTGTGDQEPLGLFIASADGITTARDVSTDNTATNITADGLINAQSQVRPVYQAKCGWVVSPTLIKNVRKLKDGTGVYIWAPGLQIGIPNTILGKAYIMSEYVPTTWTTGLYVGLYGDLSYYWIALGLGNMTVQRLLELYATTGQIGLLFDNLGVDAMPVLAEAFARVKLG